jgi:hypothetical protein
VKRLVPRMGGLRLLFSLAFRADPLRASVIVLPILALAFAAMPLAMRMVIDAIPGDDRERIVVGALIMAGTLIGAVALGFVQFK